MDNDTDRMKNLCGAIAEAAQAEAKLHEDELADDAERADQIAAQKTGIAQIDRGFDEHWSVDAAGVAHHRDELGPGKLAPMVINDTIDLRNPQTLAKLNAKMAGDKHPPNFRPAKSAHRADRAIQAWEGFVKHYAQEEARILDKMGIAEGERVKTLIAILDSATRPPFRDEREARRATPSDLSIEDRIRILNEHAIDAVQKTKPPLTLHGEQDLAQKTADRWKNNLLWDGKSWWARDGGVWREDVTELARCITAMCGAAAREAEALGKGNWNVTPVSLSSSKVARGVQDFAKQHLGFPPIVHEDGKLHRRAFDENLYLLNTPGGIIDLNGDLSKLREPRVFKDEGRTRGSGAAADYMTKITEVTPTPTVAGCPRWIQFLDEIFSGDKKLIDFMQRSAGYWLGGATKEDKIWFLYGGGRNGKDTFLDNVAGAMGNYAMNSTSSAFMSTRNAGIDQQEKIARLEGARLVTSVETAKGRAWNEELLKSLTGGGKATGRKLYKDSRDFKPRFKVLVAGNHKPTVRNVDVAITERLMLIPFNVRFFTRPSAEAPWPFDIPRDGPFKDVDLREKTLPLERSGILRWMLDGYAEYRLKGLKPPPSVLLATDAYFKEQDLPTQWLQECCGRGDDLTATTKEMFFSWSQWMKARGEVPGTDTAFGEALANIPGLKHAKVSRAGKQVRGFRGVGLLSETERGNDEGGDVEGEEIPF